METTTRFKKILIAVAFLLGSLSLIAKADEWTDGFQYISYLAAGYGSDQIQLTIGSPFINNHNPSACSLTASSGWYVTDSSNIQSRLLNTTLLMAYFSNRRVQLYITTGCLFNQARILAVNVEPQ